MILTLVACLAEETPPPLVAGHPEEWVERSVDRMHTRISVQLPATADPTAAEAALAVFSDVEEVANEWRPGSPLAAVNAAGGAPTVVPGELARLLVRSRSLAMRTEGAFDPTWAALWDLWDFRERKIPTDEQLAERLPHVGWQRLTIDPAARVVQLDDPEARLGLGGIAKGWALDGAGAVLRAHDVNDFVVSAGGQVLVGGARDGRPWRIGVRDPRGGRDDFFAAVEVTDASVSTSGDYERWFEVDGTRYHHVLDPRTGRPCRGLRSATVVALDATTADALSTAVMVLGAEQGLAVARRFPEVLAVITVDDHGEVASWDSERAPIRIERPPLP